MTRQPEISAPSPAPRSRISQWRSAWPHRSRVERATWWMLAIFLAALLADTFNILSDLDVIVLSLSSTVLALLLLILLYRWSTQRLLWKVRNRLILTYLLMGLAPVVLFLSLASLASYVLAGQYATDTALTKIDQSLTRVRDAAGSAAIYGLAHSAADTTAPSRNTQPAPLNTASVTLAELHGNTWVPFDLGKAAPNSLLNAPPPAWLHSGFQGIVAYKGQLYLCAEVSAPRSGRTVTLLASKLLTPNEVAAMGKGLGQLTLAESPINPSKAITENKLTEDNIDADANPLTAHDFGAVSGGRIQKSQHFYDLPVIFTAPLTVRAWETGDTIPSMVHVLTRTTLLYAQLFSTSAEAGAIVRWLFIGTGAFFALLELLALLMATSLSRTITRSIADLYQGTRAIDAGDLEHRIPVRRKDQLSALATSFNNMAASVRELLIQQREKERLLNELAIAQEVQTTLFPRSPAFLGALEMHGSCLAARTVGGDYFDFVFGEGVAAGSVLLALGDISGKGISAALLMSSLQSAVRAFSVGVAEAEDLPPSPAMLLKLLNEHLFRSTQAARYATLFLAVYESGTGRLTYANAGHLPPLLLSEDGSVQRLDVGGTVVGLLEFVAYDEATVQMRPGDLLVAFTDGLTEPERDEEDFGEARLLTFTQQRLQAPLTVLGMGLLHEVQRWIGQHEQPDDMTVVLARVQHGRHD